MVQLSTLLILSTNFLSVQLSKGKVYCSADTTRSGCWMCPESELGQCWDETVKEIESYRINHDVGQSAKTYCKGYAKLSKCWRSGRCCSEYAPLLAAAANICNLATRPDIEEQHLQNIVDIAYRTREQIWHNDSGKQVPKLAVTVQAYNSQSSESYSSESYTNTHTTKSDYSSQKTHRSQSSYTKSTPKPTKAEANQYDSELSEEKTNSGNDYGNKKSLNVNLIHITQPELKHHESPRTKVQQVPAKVHKLRHQAKCAVKVTKCQTKTAEKYHQARLNKAKKRLSKRVEHPLHKRAAFYHHSADPLQRIEENEAKACGLDFQGVPYPHAIPETVAKVYAEL